MYKNVENDQRQKIHTPTGQESTGYTVKELEELKIALNKKLGPEFISKRKGPGYNSIQYLEGWKAINLANEIFGPNGWCTELKDFKVDYIDDKHGAISLGLSCIVRVILKDGTFHEDVGYGSIENCRSKAMAFDKCKKEAFTDGMKRALRQFGNALGNCLYDKEFLQQITKVASEPVEFDANSLLRRSTTLQKPVIPKLEPPTRSKSTIPIDGMGKGNKGDEDILKTEEKLIRSAHSGASTSTTIGNTVKDTTNARIATTINNNNNVNRERKHTESNKSTNVKNLSERARDEVDDSFIFSDDWPDDDAINEQILNSNNYVKEDLPDSDFEIDENNSMSGIQGESTINNFTKTASEQLVTKENANTTTIIPEHVTFVSAMSADTIQQDPSLQNTLKYDTSFISSQINKSSFINHNKSLPVKKTQVRQPNENKENKIKKPIANVNTTSITKTSTKTNISNINISANNHPTTNNTSSINSDITNPVTNNPNNFNPIIKRSFGLPPNKLSNKRLKK